MARAASPQPFQKVVVATDFSPGGDRAVGRAARLPIARGGRLSLLQLL
jgi:hypothetical protein